MNIKMVVRVTILLTLFVGLILAEGIGFVFSVEKNDALKNLTDLAKKDIYFLASDNCEGRGPLTKGLDLAADYIAAQFKSSGLKPLSSDGTYFQPFKISGAKLDEKPTLVIKSNKLQEDFAPQHKHRRFKLGNRGETTVKESTAKANKIISLEVGKDFEAMGISQPGKVEGPLVFAGFGITVDDGKKYDDYAKIDAKGKIVVVFRDAPKFKDEAKIFDSNGKKRQLASLTEKILNAEKHGAIAILFVNDRDIAKDTSDALLPFNYTALSRSAGKIPAIHLSRPLANELIHSVAGKSLEQIQKSIEEDAVAASLILDDVTAALEVKITRGKDVVPLKNIAGVLEGNGPLAKETIVIGAHYDHLGYGGPSSLATQKKLAIHHGADDNGSGTTGLLELVRRFSALKNRQGRKIVFVAFSGEELGLFGSAHFVNNPLVPLSEIAAMINLDMIGRLSKDADSKKEKVLLEGTGTAEIFEPLLDKLNSETQFMFIKKKSGFGPSDHASFCEKKIPVLFFWTGAHPEYHTPLDTADRINFEGLIKIVGLVEKIAVDLTLVEKKPAFIEIKGGTSPRPAGNMPRMGIRPGYSDEKEGVLVEGVSDGDPAAKAGIKKDDRILEISGKKVTNIETYMQIMAGEKKGTTIQVGIEREGKKVKIPVKLD